jgi:hypothetical protein
VQKRDEVRIVSPEAVLLVVGRFDVVAREGLDIFYETCFVVEY